MSCPKRASHCGSVSGGCSHCTPTYSSRSRPSGGSSPRRTNSRCSCTHIASRRACGPPACPQRRRSHDMGTPSASCHIFHSISSSNSSSHSSVIAAIWANLKPTMVSICWRSKSSSLWSNDCRWRFTHCGRSLNCGHSSGICSGTLQLPWKYTYAARSMKRRFQLSLWLGLHSNSFGNAVITLANPSSGTPQGSRRYSATSIMFRSTRARRRRSMSRRPPLVTRHATASITTRSMASAGTPTFSRNHSRLPSSQGSGAPARRRLRLAGGCTSRCSTVRCGRISSPQPLPRRSSLNMSSVCPFIVSESAPSPASPPS
mmetsp:Transcript_37594/g.96188  ORF Transcript_37594/g.96188 Transcript_37594/m.96188 type:complete len:316 (+) Transcript_37594:1171-2118(+)